MPGKRRAHGHARLLDISEESKLLDEMTDHYRVVAAVQGASGRMQAWKRGEGGGGAARRSGGLDTGEAVLMLQRLHLQTVLGYSRALPRDLAQGREAVSRAADLGSARALLNLGVMALYGIGGPRNASMAAEAIVQAAGLGDPHAMVTLAGCHARGTCGNIPIDLAKARELVQSVGEKDNPQAMAVLGTLLRRGEWGYVQDYSTARTLLDRAAKFGDVSAVWQLGLMALGGEGVQPHAREAVRAFKHVAENAVWFNLLRAAEVAYVTGDVPGAYWRYRMAAEAGSRVGLVNLGFFLERGVPGVVLPNASAAFRAYRLAADQGDVPSLRRIGDMFYFGHGCERNYTRAFEIYLSNVDDAQSLFNAAWMIEMNLGVTSWVSSWETKSGVPEQPAQSRLRLSTELYLKAEQAALARSPTVRHSPQQLLAHLPSRLALWRLDIMQALGVRDHFFLCVMAPDIMQVLGVRDHFVSCGMAP